MGKDSQRIYTDRRSRSSGGSTTSKDRRERERDRQYSSSPSPDGRVVSTKVVESGPPIEIPPGAVATTKHEEWTTKKKVQQVVTKEVETRVQRQLVTEDGRVVEDSGPQITQQTREEKKINEEEDTQHKTPTGEQLLEGYVAIPGATVISTKTESRQKSHEVKEDHKETHDEQVEEISGEEFHRRAVMDKNHEGALIKRSGTPSSNFSSTGPRIVNQYSKRHKVTDKDDIQEISREKDGEVTTERTVTHQTEEEADDEVPDDAEEDQYDTDRKMIAYYPDETSPEREHHVKIHREGHHRDHREHRAHREKEHHRHRHRHDSADHSSERRRREKYRHSDDDQSRRHGTSRHREKVHKTRSTSPEYREVGIVRTGTMRSDASSQTGRSPKSQYYMGDYDYDDDRSRKSEYREKKAQDDFSSVRRHESFHHEARSSYTPLSERSNLNRSHSQRSVSTTTEDHGDYAYGSATADRRRHHRESNRSPSPGSNRLPSQKYYLGEDPWNRGSSRREERSHSRSSDLRKEAVARSYEQNRRDHSPDHRVESGRNRKDLYAWEDHRSRDYYSHSTRLDDEDRDGGGYSGRPRHRSGSADRDYIIGSYSPPANKDYGPTYSVSAHSRSEDFEKDPHDPHKRVHRTASQSKSEDVKTVPIHDGGKKVTVSKVQQKHYRSEMKYGDRGMGSPPPTSPPPMSGYGYDAVDAGSYDRRNRNVESRYADEAREEHRMSRTNTKSTHDNMASSSHYRLDDYDDRYQNGFEDDYPSYSHYKTASDRQRFTPKGTSRSDSPDALRYPYREDTINITPDYTSRSRYRSDSPDPVLTCPTFTPLQSPLSVKTADETKTSSYGGFQSKYDRDTSDDFSRNTSSYRFNSGQDNDSGRLNFRSQFDKDESLGKTSDSYKYQFQGEADDLKFQGRQERDHESLNSSIYSRYKSKLQDEKDDTPKEYSFSGGLKPLAKIEVSDSIGRSENISKISLKEDRSERDSLKKYSSFERENNQNRKSYSTFEREKKPSIYESEKKPSIYESEKKPSIYESEKKPSSYESEIAPLRKLNNISSPYKYEPPLKKEAVTPPPPELPSSPPPISPPRRRTPVNNIGFTESIVLPDISPKDEEEIRDNESVKSDKSRTSTRTFTLEDSNTNSLKKIHLNPTFKRDVSPPQLNKRPVKPISEEHAPEPMKQIPKQTAQKKTPVAVPPRPAKSLIHSTAIDASKKPSGKTSKAPPVAPKRTRSQGTKKPVLVEVRGWDNR